jgi:hypothetical protein
MAKYERTLSGNFQSFVGWLNDQILNASSSGNLEDGSDMTLGDVRVAVRVYERYSMAGGNRVSMNVTVVGRGNDLFVSAITSGGSQAVFFKINTIGEETFLDTCRQAVEQYASGSNPH